MGTLSAILQIENLGQCYTTAGKPLEVLREVNFQIEPKKMVAVQGESGSGKTTLLLACGGMQKPTTGEIAIIQQDVFKLSPAARGRFRAKNVGYMFQTLELVPYLCLLDNVRIVKGVTTETAIQWLAHLGLADRIHHKPDALSHGQRQRAALARAIAHRPALVIADEPTGNLDEKNSRLVFDTLRQFADDGCAVLVATHDSTIADYADRLLRIESASLIECEALA